ILLQAALTLATSIIPWEHPTLPSTCMDLDAMTPADCGLRFSMDNRFIVPEIEILCIVLRCLSHLDDLGKEFGCEGSEISWIYQWDIAHICTLFKVLQEYDDAVWDTGTTYVDCFGFVDSTVLQICRPLHDPGYSAKFHHLQYPFKSAFPMLEQHTCNVEMSQHQICVEWGWGKAKTEFATLDWQQMHKVLLSPLHYIFFAVFY
ncbi:hypothetical protein M427DRAFT_54602, partial [Gonapodya prolifera JEL478]